MKKTTNFEISALADNGVIDQSNFRRSNIQKD